MLLRAERCQPHHLPAVSRQQRCAHKAATFCFLLPMSHYDTLEVSPHASPEVIRAAYKSLMQRFHPDKHPGNSAVAQKAGLITRAYDTLADPIKRSAYDQSLSAAGQAEAAAPHSVRSRPPDSTRSGRSLSQAAPAHNRAVGLFWGIVTVIVVAGGVSLWLLKSNTARKNLAALSLQSSAKRGVSSAAPAMDQTPKIFRLGTSLQVLVGASGNDPGRIYTLTIPALDVQIGSTDADEFARTLGQQREMLKTRLNERLALAQPDELLKTSGQQYLQKLMVDALVEITGTDTAQRLESPPASPQANEIASARYGVIGVVMPDGFTLK